VSLAFSWFTPDGLIREEHVYADGRSLSVQPAASPARGRPFDGLPTTREVHEATGAADEQANVALLRASFSAPVLVDDAELVDFTKPGSLVGKKYAARWTAGRAGGTKDGATIKRSWGIGGYVLCEYETTGERPASGAEVFEIEGAKVKRGWRYEEGLDKAPASGLPSLFPLAVP
jgi:hypothetical protein